MKEITEFGIETVLDDQIRAIIPKASLQDLEIPVKGQTVAGVILYVDYDFGVVEMTLQPDIIKRSMIKSKKLPNEGQTVKATCVLKRTENHFATFCVKNPHQYQGLIVHVPMRKHLNDFMGFGDVFNLYDTYSITIMKISNSEVVGVYEKLNSKINQKRIRNNSLNENSSPIKNNKKARVDSESSDTTKINVTEKDKEMENEPPEEKNLEMEDPGWNKDFNPWGTGILTSNESKPEILEEAIEAENSNSKKIKTHLSKKEKKELERLEELAIKEAEKRVVEGQDVPPESVDEFDRLVFNFSCLFVLAI